MRLAENPSLRAASCCKVDVVNGGAGSLAPPLVRSPRPRAHALAPFATWQIESYVYDVVRSCVPKIDLDDVFTTKETIAKSISENLKAVRQPHKRPP